MGSRPKGKGKGKGKKATAIRLELETVSDRQAKALAAVEDEEDVDALLEALQMDTGVDWCVGVRTRVLHTPSEKASQRSECALI